MPKPSRVVSFAALALAQTLVSSAFSPVFAQEEIASSQPSGLVDPVQGAMNDPHTTGGIGISALGNRFQFNVNGYARMGLNFTQSDVNAPYVGKNNGFSLLNARLETDAHYLDKVLIRISIEGAYNRGDTPENTVSETQLALRDAYLAYEPWRFLRLTAGQFKPPFDAEDLTDTRELSFVNRSVESVGVPVTRGYYTLGLSVDRQVGLRVSGFELKISDAIKGSYFLAVTNTNGSNLTANSNDSLAEWGRGELTFLLGRSKNLGLVRIGGAGYYNPQTVGTFPNLYNQTAIGATGDLLVQIKAVQFMAVYMFTETQYPSTKAPDTIGQGAHAQIGYHFWFNLTPAYRISYYDPNNLIAGDAILWQTLALNYLLPWAPIKVQAEGTLALEQPQRRINNNQLDFLIQAAFP